MSSTQIGVFNPANAVGEYNKISFAISQALAKMQTAMPVEVMACTNYGGLSLAGTVDIRPLVNMIDGNNPPNPVPHGTIYGVPYVRVQGGLNACIIDPAVGDIGIAIFASRDITKVVATRAQANPGSWRQYNWGDAMYIGGLLNAIPVQFVRFSSTGIELVSPTAVTVTAPSIFLDGSTDQGTPDIEITPAGVEISSASTSITANSGPIDLSGNVNITGNLSVSSGSSGNFSTPTGQIVTVQNGIIVSIE